MWAGMPGIFLRQIHEKQYPASLEPYTGNILLIAVTYDKNTKQHTCIMENYQKAK
jgi:hypothetical protein